MKEEQESSRQATQNLQQGEQEQQKRGEDAGWGRGRGQLGGSPVSWPALRVRSSHDLVMGGISHSGSRQDFKYIHLSLICLILIYIFCLFLFIWIALQPIFFLIKYYITRLPLNTSVFSNCHLLTFEFWSFAVKKTCKWFLTSIALKAVNFL